MQGHEIRTCLHSGARLYGTHVCGLTHANATRILTAAPLDFAFFCTEHMPLDRSELAVLCQLYAGRGISPIVRLPYPCARQAAMALDVGAQGIVAPYVETVEEVQEVVGAVRYRPIKGQVLRQFLSGKRRPSRKTVEFLHRFNRDTYTIIGIESIPAYENLDALIGVDGVDGVFIGPHDLSVSLEAPEEWENPEFFRIIVDIVRRCRAARVGVGVHTSPAVFPMEKIQCLAEAGMNWILDSADAVLAQSALRERRAELCGDATVPALASVASCLVTVPAER